MQGFNFHDKANNQLKLSIDRLNLLLQETCYQTLPLNTILEKIGAAALDSFLATFVGIWYWHAGEVKFIVCQTPTEHPDRIREVFSQFDLNQLIEAADGWQILDISNKFDSSWLESESIKAAIAAPLYFKNRSRGAIALFARQLFDPESLQSLPLLTGLLIAAIDNAATDSQPEVLPVDDKTHPSSADSSLASMPVAGSELLRSHQLLKMVIEHLAAAILIVDYQDLLIQQINSAALRMLDLPAEVVVVGRRFDELVPQLWREEIIESLSKLRETNGNLTIAEYEYHQPGCRLAYWRIDAQYLNLSFFGEQDKLLISFIDISEVVVARQRIEQVANEAQERVTELDAVISQMAEGVIVVDSLSRILNINPRGMELLSISTISTQFSNHAHTYHLYRLDGEMLMDQELPFVRAVERGEIVKDFEILVHPPDNNKRVISVNAAPLLNSEGLIIGAVAAFHDITDRILYQKVLEENNEQLLEVDRLKTRFISTVSHELRTPLNAITGLVQLLQRDKSELLSERQLDMVSRIALNSKQLMMLINDLLDYSRLASGKETVNLTRFLAEDLIEKVWVGLIDTALAKGLESTREIGKIGEIESDYTKCYQVLTNLLGNAIKYTQKGNIIVRAYLIDDQFWAIEIVDTGAGIPSEDVDSIFDEFRRSRNAEMGKVTGTGLGLPISRKMVELMGGKIEAESTFDKGSLFRVIWPRYVSRFISPELIAGHNHS